MKKTRLVWILTGLAALATILLILFLPNFNSLSVGRARVEQLPEGQTVLGNAWPEIESVQKGDAFLYTIQILYDSGKVSGIDSDSLDSAVNLEPFEIRGTQETEFNVDAGSRVYQRQYEIQLLGGETAILYEFPTIVVRYRIKGTDGYAETSVKAEPVYVAPRIPASSVNEIAAAIKAGNSLFRTLEGKIEDSSQNRLPWILLVLGVFLGGLMVADVTLRVIPQRREKARQSKEIQMSHVLRQAYRSLLDNAANCIETKSLLHQIDHILRVLLSPKEKVGWLEEPNLDQVPDEIRPSVISLLEKSQRAYGTEDIKQGEVEEDLKQLEEIFRCYFAGEMEAWRS